LIYVLAGGRSTRMKDADKAHMKFAKDRTILGFILDNLTGHFSTKKVSLVVKNHEDFLVYQKKYKVGIVEDLIDAGPLGGIYSGLQHSTSAVNFFMGCDMPFLQPELVEWMLNNCQQDILIPRQNSHLEPLAAVYQKSCLSAIKRALDSGSRKILDFFPEVEVEYLEEDMIQAISPFNYHFFNINNKKDYQFAVNEIIPLLKKNRKI